MSKERAYKLLALELKISNNKAKELIDDGLVFARGAKIAIAREMLDVGTKFKVIQREAIEKIYEDDNIIALNKPISITSSQVEEKFGFALLHRLDKETSGVLLLAKNSDFQKKAIDEFRAKRVKKTYLAIVKGVVKEPFTIDEPLITLKGKGGAFTKLSKYGKEAITHVEPYMISGKKTLLNISIETGRTHQIRVHLASAGYPIVGDEKYGNNSSMRMFLHAYKIELLGYKFIANLKNNFNEFGFELPKDLPF